jgi:plastocyanin
VDTINATPGVLSVTLTNNGAVYHTLAMKGTALDLKTNPGKSATGTVTLSKGTYVFECTVAGHAAAGMKGKVVVG